MANDWIRYSNNGTRNQPLNARLIDALSFLPAMGVTMDVFSGGQPSSGPGRVGSHRHDLGNAGDVMFYKDGRALNWANPADVPIFQQIVQRANQAGVTGIGAGEGYMRPGSMHIGFGTPAVWGAGGRGVNAPNWLREAYGGGGGAVPTALGDIVAPTPVATTAVAGTPEAPAFNMMLRARQEQAQAKAEEERALQQRRAALFSPPQAPLATPPQPNVWRLYG